MKKPAPSESTISTRLKIALEESGFAATSVSRQAGLSLGAVHDIIHGRSKRPSLQSLSAIAQILNVDLAFLTGDQDTRRSSFETIAIPSGMPVVGTVEAGIFSEMSGAEPWLNEDEFETIEAPRSGVFPRARHFAWRVRGDSMNAAQPRALTEGEFVTCIDVIDAELGIVDGEIYVVRRSTDGGSTHEWTLKRARVFRNRIELWPESTNPTHKPLTIYPDNDADTDVLQIAAVGLVYGAYSKFGRYA